MVKSVTDEGKDEMLNLPNVYFICNPQTIAHALGMARVQHITNILLQGRQWAKDVFLMMLQVLRELQLVKEQ